MGQRAGLWLLLLLLLAGRVGLGQRPSKTMAMSDRRVLPFLLERFNEPIFTVKGDAEQVVFRVPARFLRDRFQALSASLLGEADGASLVDVPDLTLPDLSLPLQLGRREQFSLFFPAHRRMARRLIEVFLGLQAFPDFLAATAFCRERVNPFLLTYAVAVALLHRPDTRGVPLPNPACLFPQKYLPGSVFPRLREEAGSLTPGQRSPVVIPRDWTASDLEPEHRVAYFREDIGINLHHWHWHLVYPFEGPPTVVAKDRRGELFYYMHHQIMSRFNFERLCNQLSRARRFLNWHEPLEEGYFPKLNTQISSRVWPSRPANSKLQDIQREDLQIAFDIQDLERWRDRMYEGIHLGRVQTEAGEWVALDERQGIDILGNMMESSMLSINRNLYGDLHNLGHVAISFVHDPDNRNLEPFGVMGDSTTAMRDPVFYRWHAFVDDLFQEHKATLPRYTTQQLGFQGVTLRGLSVQTQGLGRPNELRTFWQQSDIDLSRGLDFAPRGPVVARVTHLQHAPFAYRIQIGNAGAPRLGTVRIFLAPRLDERRLPMAFRDQRLLFVEMDKFTVSLRSGLNTVLRPSNESSVAVPSERTFRNLDARPPGPAGEQFDYCGCGWPQHMLVPKGSADGFQAELFAMVSDFAGDQVEGPSAPNACTDGHSLCGIRGQKYPDRRSMGFPFDRLPRFGVGNLAQFLTDNMRVVNVSIRHDDRTLPPGRFV